MRQFLLLVRVTRELRNTVEDKLSDGYQSFLSARMDCSSQLIENALSVMKRKINLQVEHVPVMNLRVPQLTITSDKDESFGLDLNTPGDLDRAIRLFNDLLPQLIQLAQNEKSIQLISDELERTRRRVNALEYILMPNLIETIKFIQDKLTELERSNISRLMKVKEIVKKE